MGILMFKYYLGNLPAHSSQTRGSLGLLCTLWSLKDLLPRPLYEAEKSRKMDRCGSWMRDSGRSGAHRSKSQDICLPHFLVIPPILHLKALL